MKHKTSLKVHKIKPNKDIVDITFNSEISITLLFILFTTHCHNIITHLKNLILNNIFK